jgi:hypothetical protein
MSVLSAPAAPVALPRPRRLIVRCALAVATVLVATAVLLALRLPDAVVAAHWSLAWAGLDVATAAAAVGSALLLHRGDRRAAIPAAAGAALLAIDAWMDVTTSAAGAARVLAIVEAAAVEVPLAVAALLVALRLLSPPGPDDLSYPPPTRITSRLHS